MSRFNNPNGNRSRGFSLLEVIIAMAVLVIGVAAMAALTGTMLNRGRQSKYMSMAGTLASEKLEDLNRWSWNNSFDSSGNDISDPQVCVQSGDTTEGSLTADIGENPVKSITCNGVTENITYFDDVSIDMSNSTDCPSPADGCFAESTSTTNGGTTTYYTTYHSPDGTIPGFPAGTAAGTGPGNPIQSTVPPTFMTYHRRWVIEANPVINGVAVSGVRRITVLVTLKDSSIVYSSIAPGVSFQMSEVRP